MTAPFALTRAQTVTWLADTAERVGRTFAQAFLAFFLPALPLPGSVVQWSTLEKAAAAGVGAGVAAVLTLLTSMVARWSGSRGSASFIASNVIDTTATEIPLVTSVGELTTPAGVTVNITLGGDAQAQAQAPDS